MAVKILLESNVDDVFLVDDSNVIKLEKGRYGGWLLRGEGPDSGRGLWCFAVDEQEAPGDAVEKVNWAKERMVKVVRSLGVKDEPKVLMKTYKFRLVDAAQRKATEKYTVYDITPTGEEVEATVAAVKFEVRMSKRGKCYNDVCRVRERLAMLLRGEFKGEEAAVDGVTVMVPYDTSKLEEAVAKLMDVDEAAAEEAVEEGGGGEEGEGVDGGKAVSGEGKRAKDFIGYLILVKFPRNVDGNTVMAELERAVKQKLKELNVTASVGIAEADL
jgi:hypothetical protein